MKMLLKYLKGYGKECVLAPLFKMLEATFELLVPLVVARIVDVAIVGNDRAQLVKMCALLILLGLVGLASAVTAQYFSAVAATGLSQRLRHAVMEHILHLDCSSADALGTSTLITRMTGDINQVQTGVNLTLRLLLRSPFVVFGAMVMAFTIDVPAALIFAAVIPVLCVVVFGLMLITMPLYKKVQSGLDRVTLATRQNLNGVRVLRAFCMEEQEVADYTAATGRLKDMQLLSGRISALLNPVTYVIINLAVIALIRTGALRVELGILSQGLVLALYNYMSQILVELIKMTNLIISITKAVACAGRLEELLDTPAEGVPSQSPAVTPPPEGAPNRKANASLQGRVVFDNVTARYPGAGAPSLTDISFAAAPGSTVGIVGSTGAGKTTLVNLIPGLYPTEQGSVTIDGIPAADYDGPALRRQIGIVPQKAVLFKGTIRDNLCWGKSDATDEELWEALATAQAAEVVQGRPEGLSAPVEQGGVNFSGGQRQRLTIARALVRKPAILILDDSASALDYGTAAALRKAIKSMDPAPTTFIVSQRAADIMHADLILVLEDGALVSAGKHEELLASCPVYKEIYDSQFQSDDPAGEVTVRG